MFKKKNKKDDPTETPTLSSNSEDKYVFKGCTEVYSLEEIKKAKGGFLVSNFIRIPNNYFRDNLLKWWDINFSSWDIAGFDSMWQSLIHSNALPESERNAKILVRNTLPNGRIDISKYTGRDKEFTDKLIKVYDILLDDVKQLIEINKSKEETEEKENIELSKYLREEYGVKDFNLDSWKIEELGITHISPKTNSDGKRDTDDIRLFLVTKISEGDEIYDQNLNPFVPSSLGEFNAALNVYHSNLSDLKVLAAIHKYYQSEINRKSEEDTIFKEVFNIE
jgi:hypothetical protein